MNTPIGGRLFQYIPRRVAKFRENRPRVVEKLADENKEKTRILVIDVSIGESEQQTQGLTENKPSLYESSVSFTRYLPSEFICS